MTDQNRLHPDQAASVPPSDQTAPPESDTIPRAIFHQIPAAMAWHRLVLDEDGQPQDFVFLEVNRVFEELTGLKRDEIIGRGLGQVLPGGSEAGRDWIQSYGRVALTGREVTFDQYSAPLDKWFLITAFCPQPGQFVTFYQDITEARQAAEDLLDLQLRHQIALESCPTPLFISDSEGLVRYLNPALETALGWTVEDLLDRPVSLLLDKPLARCAGQPVRAKTKDGRETAVALHVSPINDAAGDPAGHVVFLGRPESDR
jgi:PAS domain S-box-containing protein